MTFFEQLDGLATAGAITDNMDAIIKVAEESDFTVNDFIVHHNLTKANIYTGENLVKVAEEVPDSRLLVAVDIFDHADEYTEEQAIEKLAEYGLTADDYNAVVEHLVEQGIEAGIYDEELSKVASDEDPEEPKEVLAEEAVWEKVAETYEYLYESGLDPVTAIEFAEKFTAAEDEAAQDKVASEYDGLDQESIDKIAEAFEYLSDIEGASLTELMAEIDKEASVKEAVVSGAKKVSESAKKALEKAWRGKEMKNAKDSLEYSKGQLKKHEKWYGNPTERANARMNIADKEKKIAAIKKHRMIVGGAGAGTVALGAGTAAALSSKSKKK